MTSSFGLYPAFYVKRKDQLFPLIEKYTGERIGSNVPHGKVIPLYYRLLRTNPAFRADVDDAIAGQYKNAGGIFASIIEGVGNIAGSIKASKEAKLENDRMFYQTVLNEQKNNDIGKIVAVSAVALAFIGIAVYLVVKSKK